MITALRRGRDCERGSITLFALIAAVGLLVAVGLAADGGTKIRASQQADGYAEEAARTAGQAILAASSIQGDQPVIDPAAAVRAAQQYLASVDVSGTVRLTGPDTLTVTVTITRPTVFVGLIGIDSVTVHGRASVRLATGEDPP